MSEKSNSDQNKKSRALSKSNLLADALERLERSVAQREGNRMASLVKPIKEDANESNEGLSKKTSAAEDGVKEPFNSNNPNVCLKIFKSNNFLGLIIFISLLIGKLN